MPDLGNRVFLSPAMSEVIPEFRAAYARIFALADKINELAHREMFATDVNSSDAQCLLLACLLHRALTTFQGVVVLCERGMPSEATTLLRTLLEVMFRLVAIAKDPEVGQAYILEDELHRQKFINKFKLLSDSVKSAVGNPILESLSSAIRQNIEANDIRELKTQWFAERADLADFYHSAYSVFSGTVHVNVRDLENALVVDGDGDVTGFNYGPTDAGLDGILLVAIESLIFCLRGAFSVLPSASQAALDAIHSEFSSLHGEVLRDTET
jgi:hypothetical protein